MTATVKCLHCPSVITQHDAAGLDAVRWRDASGGTVCGNRPGGLHEPDPATLPKPPKPWEPPTPLTVDEHLDRAEELLRDGPIMEDATVALAHAVVAVAMLLQGDR